MSTDRRLTCRYPVDSVCTLFRQGGESADPFPANILDISHRGALCRVAEPLAVGTALLLSIPWDARFALGGAVVRCAPARDFGHLIAIDLIEDWPYPVFSAIAFERTETRPSPTDDPFAIYFR